jgi:hypothetical protein
MERAMVKLSVGAIRGLAARTRRPYRGESSRHSRGLRLSDRHLEPVRRAYAESAATVGSGGEGHGA